MALSAVYRFVIEASRKKKAARPGGPDNAKGGSKNDSGAKASIP